MYLEAAVATAAALVVLVVLDWFEARLPAKRHIRHTLRFARADAIDEDALRSLLGRHHFAVRELSRGVVDAGRAFEYRMTLLTRERDAEDRLCRTLRTMPEVLEFDISPAGD
jgi:uncharacterized membrane protein YhiD involved in acid resistance